MDKPLSQEQFVAAFDQWMGSEVAVRVVSGSNDLLAVMCGRLGRCSDEKRPALFWPLEVSEDDRHAERPGVYLHSDEFQHAAAHEGGFVLELSQAGVTLNFRRL